MNKALSSTSEDTSIAAQLKWAASLILSAEAANDTALLDAKILLCHCLQRDTSYLHTWPEKTLEPEQVIQFTELIQQRCQGHPIAYLIGYRDFWTLRLRVSEATLIPRPETELLVESALELGLPDKAKVLDLGTGTGAIALALASEKSHWQVIGIDKSHDAVKLAKQNATENQLDSVRFMQSDWFSKLDKQRFDLIVTNPPYVEDNSPYLQQGDVRFEPLSALISGADGLDDIRFIVGQAKGFLAGAGWLVIEHGFEQDEKIRNIFESNAYVEIRSVSDFNGLPRVTMGKFYENDL
ncbi:peptide chain release factor N(5)-glutamine methyltransferase [Flavobacterium sp. W21_SRS_FM6]|uniref:peptide chain release factor N(5)-glutamine methyltransferase n=1 Tax=Flavobacterium sp. W21_SRS_FM6 TaxID=3240268 RepID=UPI003F8E2EC8